MRRVVFIGLFVLVFCIVLALVGKRLYKHDSRWATAVRVLLGLTILGVYVYGVLSQTILGRATGAYRKAELELFWSHRESLALIDGELSITNYALLIEIVLNVFLFVPLGALLPFMFRRLFLGHGFWNDVFRVAIVGAACSSVVELVQWYFRLGLFEFDDILDNALGAVAGYVLYRLVVGRADDAAYSGVRAIPRGGSRR